MMKIKAKIWIYPLVIMGIAAILVSSCKKDSANTYSVIYNGNGSTSGSVPFDDNSYKTGSIATVLGNTESLKKIGFSFADWNTASDGTGTDYAPDATITIGSMNVTLYANWVVGGKLTVAIADATNFNGHTIYYAIFDSNSTDPDTGVPTGNIVGQGGINIVDNWGYAVTGVSSSDPTEKVFDNGTYYFFGMVDMNDNAPTMGYIPDSGDKYGNFLTAVIDGDATLTLTEGDFPLTW